MTRGMDRVIGIDLGTTNSAMAILEAGTPRIIPNAEGQRTTPSIVAYNDGKRLVGELARRQAITNPDNTVRSIKRHMGTDHPARLDGQEYTPQEISAMILRKLKGDAEDYLGDDVERAVITVPAYFTDAQRQATKEAGKIAGLEVLRIINEPTAASLAYGLNRGEAQTILVYDLGGGTFDVSILELGDGVFEVRATSGNNRLGGDDFDDVIVEWILDDLDLEGIRENVVAMQRLREAAEQAKIELSNQDSTLVNIPYISADGGTPRHVEKDLTRREFEFRTRHLVEKTMVRVRETLRDARLTPDEIDRVLLVGGSTRMPAVRTAIQEEIGLEPEDSVNPDECVALGAAIQAEVLAGNLDDIVLLDVAPLSLGVETRGGVFTKLIERNTPIPIKRSQVFSTVADGQHTVEIHVLQGEREMARDNISLGRFELTDIPPAPRGVPQIEVTFEIDVNGIVRVSARDKATGREQAIQVAEAPDEAEVEQMVREAREHREEDKQRRETVEARNQAESLVLGARESLREAHDRADEEFTQRVQKAIEALQDAIPHGNPEELRELSEELRVALNLMGASAYARSFMEDE